MSEPARDASRRPSDLRPKGGETAAFIPYGSWPFRMSAAVAAAFAGEPDLRQVLERCGGPRRIGVAPGDR
jgi:hypothetical protein